MVIEPPQLVSYYLDAAGEKKLPRDQSGNYTVDFTADTKNNPPVAGVDTVTTVAYIRNDTEYPMELKPVTLDRDLAIVEYPEFLQPGEIALVRFAFAPSADRIRPLEGGSWDFTKIVYTKST